MTLVPSKKKGVTQSEIDIAIAGIKHEALPDLMGGNSSGHYHLTDAELSKLQNMPATGAQGADGKAATIQIGSVTSGTTASVTNNGSATDAIFNFVLPKGDKGDTGATGAKGDKGDKGDTGATGAQGAKGADGKSATVRIGTVTTGTAGTNASVTNTGTATDAVLNFTIPKGDKGADGAGGSGTAATIRVGTVTTGAAGTQASVINSGTTTNAVLDFTIPRGNTGANGAKGADGKAATITVGAVITGAAGSQASVTNSGTATDAVLNFVIPKGADGSGGSELDDAVFEEWIFTEAGGRQVIRQVVTK